MHARRQGAQARRPRGPKREVRQVLREAPRRRREGPHLPHQEQEGRVGPPGEEVRPHRQVPQAVRGGGQAARHQVVSRRR